jgi:hypothetical protein
MQKTNVAVESVSDGETCVITTTLRMYNTCRRMTEQIIAADAIIRQ